MTHTDGSAHALQRVYDKAFYADQIAGSVRSAAVIVPRILKIFGQVKSVADIGCGAGAWLHQFQLNGVQRVRGLDGGDPTETFLHIEKNDFLSRDLSMPFDLGEKFDLAMSLEVAEHIAPEYANNFVSNLTRLSDLVVFGAAIPGQGGTNHFNERWPSYWAALFRQHGYRCFDILRKDLWYDQRVEWWYRQNILIFAREDRKDLMALLMAKSDAAGGGLDLVHPQCFDVYRSSQEQAKIMVPPAPPPPVTIAIADDSSMVASELIELQSRLAAIEQSAGWRMILSLRRLVTPFPALRSLARVVAKAVLRVFSPAGKPRNG